MYFHMPTESATRSKSFSTNSALIRFLFSVRPSVKRQSSRMTKTFSANRTQIRLVPAVRSGMQLQIVRRGKSPLANCAFVLLFPRMHPDVSRDTRLRVKALSADVAEELPFEFVAFFVGVKNVLVRERFLAF